MKPTKIYAEVLEEEALKQFNDVMALDCVVQGALMPDAHTGYVLPIGGVVAVRDYVFPAFVGYDIGCGVSTMKINLKTSDIDLEATYDAITKAIPVGFNKHDTLQHPGDLEKFNATSAISRKMMLNALHQLGTLGGGNHFIELGEGADGFLWITIHSGSRKLGHSVAEHYMKLAAATPEIKQKVEQEFEAKNQDFKQHNPEGYERAKAKYVTKNLSKVKLEEANGLHVSSLSGQDYIKDLAYCLEYALENRKRMVYAIHEILGKPDILQFINRNHNHAEFKDGLWIHRKGATHAEEGMMGVIPGNRRDGCFVVKGKGNPDSMSSSSHGAGRVLSRKKAKELLSMDEYQTQMEGIVGTVTLATLDEAPDAYKNIFKVMELQEDLVEVVDYLKSVLNIKDDYDKQNEVQGNV